MKAGLLEGVVAETQPSVRKALADTVSKLAGIAASSGARSARGVLCGSAVLQRVCTA